jgi:hypothetical protein
MTKRMLVVAGLIAASVAVFPSSASASGLDDIWDIVDALSGPGPFSGIPVATAKISCWQNGVAKVTTAMLRPDKNDPCLYFEFHRLHVDAKAPYAEVTAKLFGLGVSFELDPALEVGAGAGVAYFSTTVGTTDFNVTNFTVTPRLVFRPLRLVPRWRNNTRLGFLQMHYRPTVRFGDIDGSDFGAPASTFSAGTELLEKSGSWIVIDVLEALRPAR